LAGQYLEAWQTHDVDAIVALHTADSIFTSVTMGTEAIGRDAVREVVAETFAAWPDLHFHPHRIHTTPNLIVAESTIETTPALPLWFGDTVVKPNGKTITFAVADILVLDNGLVKRKDSYVDTLGYLRQMRASSR
jgi:steroid delta-isomerase-like uncharacterized protein